MKRIAVFIILLGSISGFSQKNTNIGLSFLGTDYYDLLKNKTSDTSLSINNFDPGVRFSLAKFLTPKLALRGNVNLSSLRFPNSDSTIGASKDQAFSAGLDARLDYHFLSFEKFVSPYIFAGLGATRHSELYAFNIPVGVGLNFNLGNGLRLPIEFSYRNKLSSNDYNHYQVAAGFSYLFGGEKAKTPTVVAPPPPPAQPVVVDTDKDGIPDAEDKCPTVFGIAKYAGCPIPDTDKDGINDENDKCPTVFGIAKYGGCPIPDSDNDGFNDEVDKCPNVYSTTNNGCPEIKSDVVAKVNKAAGAVYFDSGKSTLKKASYTALNVIASVLNDDATLFCDIIGNTDNSGDNAKNVQLSKDRAKACLDYLISKGISASRLTSDGVGPENPVADNATPAGRALNRRTDFKLRNF